MPTRRIFELIIVTGILMVPAKGLLKMWAAKTLNTSDPGTIPHGAAQIVTVIS